MFEVEGRGRTLLKFSLLFSTLLTFDGVFAGGGTSICAAEDMARVIVVAAGRAGARGREREAARRQVRSAIRSISAKKVISEIQSSPPAFTSLASPLP